MVVDDVKATVAVTTVWLQALLVLHEMRQRERQALTISEPNFLLECSLLAHHALLSTLVCRMFVPIFASFASSLAMESADPSKAMLALRQGPPLSGTAISE